MTKEPIDEPDAVTVEKPGRLPAARPKHPRRRPERPRSMAAVDGPRPGTGGSAVARAATARGARDRGEPDASPPAASDLRVIADRPA